MPVVNQAHGETWASYLGDSIEWLPDLPDASVDEIVGSPPFDDLYVYTGTPRDLGNSRSTAEFFEHQGYLTRELYRVLKPGRVAAIHVMDIPATLIRDGYIGLKDFSGDVIRHFISHGFVYDARIPIDKNPQPLRDGTPVLTPAGWVPIERLRVGDPVIGGDGRPTAVVAVPYRGRQPMLRLTFDDGASVECGESHLWQVRTSADNPWLVMRADELMRRGVKTPSGRWRYQIPVTDPVQFAEGEPLPIHPRTLGALLADGQLGDTIAVTKDRELVESLPLPEGHRWVARPGSERAGGRTMTYGVTGPEWHRNDVLEAVRGLHLAGHRAWEKFIPECYLLASESDRRELLRGLLDGDGSIQGKGGIYYKTTAPQLAYDVVSLVQSLGGLATAREIPGGRYGDGQQGRPLWEISIRMGGDWCPFSLDRKAERWSPGRRGVRRNIVAIEPIGEGDVTCISVAAPDGLFLADGCVVTHNSQSIRTKAKGLTFQQLERDQTWSRPALPDYILKFRKPGENAVPVIGGDITRDLWIEWADPTWPNEHDRCADAGAFATWYGISEGDTLSRLRDKGDDGRHVCPLQLGTIERCIRLWTNRGEAVLDPWGGIASVGYVATLQGRRWLGCELKKEWWAEGIRNLHRAEAALVPPPDMFSMIEAAG
jgi:hypothetical protein